MARSACSLRGRPRCGTAPAALASLPGPVVPLPARASLPDPVVPPAPEAPAEPRAVAPARLSVDGPSVFTGSPSPIWPAGIPAPLVLFTTEVFETIRSVFLFRRTSCRRHACRAGPADRSRRDQPLCMLPPPERSTAVPAAIANPPTLSRCARTAPRTRNVPWARRTPQPPQPPRAPQRPLAHQQDHLTRGPRQPRPPRQPRQSQQPRQPQLPRQPHQPAKPRALPPQKRQMPQRLFRSQPPPPSRGRLRTRPAGAAR